MAAPKPIEAKPFQGGALMSAVSSEQPGIFNYTIKRNWRRYLDREIRVEGHVRFCPLKFDGSIPMPTTEEDITLCGELIHPNGKRAVIVGTPSRVFRYLLPEDCGYVESGYVTAGYVRSTIDNPWLVIWQGSPGRIRWEAVPINGWLTLNNGSDIPYKYRITDEVATPIYEMREQGIAAVGTITDLTGILLVGDVSQFNETSFAAQFAPVAATSNVGQTGAETSGTSTAVVNNGTTGVEGNTITANNSTFNSGSGFTGLEGTVIRMANGLQRTITSVTSPTVATLGGVADLSEPASKFYILDEPADYALDQPYSVFTGIDPTQMPGLRIWWDSGESRTVVSVVAGVIYVNDDQPIPSGPCKMENPNAYARVDDTSLFDRLKWRMGISMPNQPPRWGAVYTGTVTPSSDTLILDYPVKSIEATGQSLLLTGMKAGNLPIDIQWFDGLRVLAANGAIRGFYQDVLDSLTTATQAVVNAQVVVQSTSATLLSSESALAQARAASDADLDNATKKQAVADASAAVDLARSNLELAQKALVDAQAALVTAQTNYQTSEAVDAKLLDAVGSIAGTVEDIQDDGSGIMKMVPLRTQVIVYKETSIFVVGYTGVVATPLSSTKVPIPLSCTLRYRNTPILVDGDYHLYAGRTSFYRFDLTGQLPQEIKTFELCKNVFFDQAKIVNTESIFAFDTTLTKEVFICFPSTSDDKALRFDYEAQTISTCDYPYTSGAAVQVPGGEETWTIMGANSLVLKNCYLPGPRTGPYTGSKTGSVVTITSFNAFDIGDIGKTVLFANGLRFAILDVLTDTTATVAGDDDVTAQAFYVEQSAYSRIGDDYQSVLQDGTDSFGNESVAKTLVCYVPMLSSFSPNTEMTAIIRSGVNTNLVTDKVISTITPEETLLSILLEDYFIGSRIEVDGINNPIELTGRIFDITRGAVQSFGRRKT